MKRVLILMLALVLSASTVLAITGCKGEEKQEGPVTSVSAYKSEDGYADLGDEKLSREGLDALPKKYPGMPTQEARQICVDFWDYVKTALWIPDAQYHVYKDPEAAQPEIVSTVEQGKIYAGLPYVSSSTGNIYRLLDFMDPETGVVNITDAGVNQYRFGGMCSSGCFFAWARVMNSAFYRFTKDTVASNGHLPVGPYTYDVSISLFETNGYGTDDICLENGEQVMYQSYAQMEIADGLISVWEKNGHTMMCTVAPHVEYKEDGTISGAASYLCITEQGGAANNIVSAQGRPFYHEGGHHLKTTFQELFKKNYLPFTFAELIGTDPIEETEASFSHTGDTITKEQVFSSKVTSNYNITDVYVIVHDSKGNEVYKHAVRAYGPTTRELAIDEEIDHVFTWGSWDDLDPKKDYTLKVEVQLGTGERPVLWEGKLEL